MQWNSALPRRTGSAWTPEGNPCGTFGHETQRLVHELNSQVELEMQNEELRRARDIAEAAMEKYNQFDFAPIACT